MENKSIIKVILAILAVLSLFAFANAHRMHEEAQMAAYAEANDCTWTSDYYVNVPPVCK